MQWALEAAWGSRLTEVLVSTEDEEVAEVTMRLGADYINRPAELSEDHVLTQQVLDHALIVARSWGRTYDYVVCLQPDNPFRTAADINAVIDIAENTRASMVHSYIPLHQHPVSVDESGRIVDMKLGRAEYYRPAGLIELYRMPITQSQHEFINCYIYEPPQENVFDINTPWDLELAEMIVQKRKAMVRPKIDDMYAIGA